MIIIYIYIVAMSTQLRHKKKTNKYFYKGQSVQGFSEMTKQ